MLDRTRPFSPRTSQPDSPGVIRRARAPWLSGLGRLALALFFFLSLTPLQANAQLGIEILDVRPLKDDAFVYMTVAGTSQGEQPQGRLAVDYYLRNNGSTTRRIHHVTLDFENPNMPSIDLRDDLRMWCPWPRRNPQMLSLTVQTGLDIEPGVRCRLGLLNDPHLSLPTATRLRVTIYFEIGGFQLGVSDIERDLVNHTNPTPTGSYRFPFKQKDMPPGTYASARSPAFFGSHRFGYNPREVHAYDMGLGRWDDGVNGWVPYFPLPAGQPAPLLNEEFLHWGLPVYAMADGIVNDCASGNLDDTPTVEQGSSVPANAFTIQHGDEVAWYGHLRFGSIDQSICFDGAVVSEGQYLGQVGNSGSSSNPHLHLQVTRAGEAIPLHFNDVFVIDRDVHQTEILAGGNMPWARVAGHGLPKEKTILWSSGLRRRGDFDSGIPSVQNVLTKASAFRTVTASRMPSGDLRTLLWRTDLSGNVAALDGDLGGAVQDLSLATPTSTQDAALAVITGGGSLKLIAYDVVGNTLTRTAEHTTNSAQAVVASPAPFVGGIMTAVRTHFGNFKLIAWQVDPEAGIINRRADADGGAVQALSLVNTSAFEGVVAAVVTGSGKLKLLTFDVPFAGFSVQRADDYQDDDVDAVSITHLGVLANGEDLVVTASRTDVGNLELIAWSIDWQGDITRLGDTQAGAIGEVKAARIDQDHVLTTVTDSSGDLKVVAWHVSSDGTITRSADLEAGAASAIAQSNAIQTVPSLSVTALSDRNGELKVIQVENNPSH